jgi:hypothetical protein
MQQDETWTEQGTEESIASEDMESFPEEDADQSDEIQSFRNITEKAAKIMVRIKQHNLPQIPPLKPEPERPYSLVNSRVSTCNNDPLFQKKCHQLN